MADKKISALDPATTPLAGTEVLPIVQSGATVKVSVANLTAGRAIDATSVNKVAITAPATGATLTIDEGKTLTASNSLTLAGTDATTMTFPTTSATVARTDAANSFTGDQTLATGNLIIGTDGKGIDFSATPGTGTSELLNDYEEGTWTPTITIATPDTFATASPVGRYTKVGNLVTVVGRISFTKGTGTGDLSLGGLPFASVNLSFYQCAGTLSTDEFGVAGKIYQILLSNNSTTPVFLSITQSNGSAAIASNSDFGAGTTAIRYAITYQTN